MAPAFFSYSAFLHLLAQHCTAEISYEKELMYEDIGKKGKVCESYMHAFKNSGM